MIGSFLGFLLGFIYGSFAEHFVHKKLFHGYGKKKNSIFAFHLRGHHINCRKNNFFEEKISWREVIGVPAILIIHIPFALISLPAYYGMITYGLLFVIIHNTMHRFPNFSKKYIWWHWNHHMKNQNKSFNVVVPIADIALKTLQPRAKTSHRKKSSTH